jgi:hypothetical protein
MKNWWFQPVGFLAEMGGVGKWVATSARLEEASVIGYFPNVAITMNNSLDVNISGSSSTQYW